MAYTLIEDVSDADLVKYIDYFKIKEEYMVYPISFYRGVVKDSHILVIMKI